MDIWRFGFCSLKPTFFHDVFSTLYQANLHISHGNVFATSSIRNICGRYGKYIVALEQMIKITNTILLNENDVEISFTKSSGPGGQNVNKVETAVQLRFDARRCRALSNAIYLRLVPIAGSRLTKDGVIVILANSHRTQERNKADAIERLADLIHQATHVPKARKATKPSRAAKARRVDTKKQRSTTKKNRGRVSKSDY